MNGVGSWSAMGAVVGAGFGLGWVLVFLGLPAQRRPGLDARLAPYLRDAVAPSRLLASMPRSRSRAAEVAAP